MSDRVRRTKFQSTARDRWDLKQAEEEAHDVCKPLACKFQTCLQQFLYSPKSVKDKHCGPKLRAWEACFAREVEARKHAATATTEWVHLFTVGSRYSVVRCQVKFLNRWYLILYFCITPCVVHVCNFLISKKPILGKYSQGVYDENFNLKLIWINIFLCA